MAEKPSRPSHARLHLVTDQESVVLKAKCSAFLQVVVVGDNDTCVALDGLNEEGSKIMSGSLERFPECQLVVIRN